MNKMTLLHVLIGLYLIILGAYELYIKQNGGDIKQMFLVQDILMYSAIVIGSLMVLTCRMTYK